MPGERAETFSGGVPGARPAAAGPWPPPGAAARVLLAGDDGAEDHSADQSGGPDYQGDGGEAFVSGELGDEGQDQPAQRRFVTNAGTVRQLMRWCEQWSERRFAVEGAKGLGRSLAQQARSLGNRRRIATMSGTRSVSL